MIFPGGARWCDECELPILRDDDYIHLDGVAEADGGFDYHEECYDLRDGVPVEEYWKKLAENLHRRK